MTSEDQEFKIYKVNLMLTVHMLRHWEELELIPKLKNSLIGNSPRLWWTQMEYSSTLLISIHYHNKKSGNKKANFLILT